MVHIVFDFAGFVPLINMIFLLRWISGGSLWISTLLVRILTASSWLLGNQGKQSTVKKDVEAGQDAGSAQDVENDEGAVAGGAVSL